jgi:hypothetical protein
MAVVTAGGGLLNVYLALSEIPRFAQIFHRHLGAQSLPPLTAILIDNRWLFTALACLWPMIAIGAVWLRRPHVYIVWTAVLITLQVAYTVIALWMPLFTVLGQNGG